MLLSDFHDKVHYSWALAQFGIYTCIAHVLSIYGACSCRLRSPKLLKHTGSIGKLFYFMYLQFTTSVVGILDGISDWPEEVVQEQSSAYVFNNHPHLLLLLIYSDAKIGVYRIVNIQQLIQLLPVHCG